MAMMRRLGSLADLLLRHHLGQQDAEYRSELTRQRQEELSRQNFAQTVLGRIAQDPAMAQRLRDAGQTEVAGFDTNIFVPSEAQASGELAAKISEKPETFDPLSIIKQYQATPGAAQGTAARAPIEQLIQQRNQRLELGRNTTPRQAVDAVLPSGATEKRFINPAIQEEPIQTGLSAEQQGANKLVGWKQFEGSPEYLKTQVDQAGKVAGREAGSRLYAEAAFYDSAAGKKLLNAKTQAALSQAKSQAEGAAVVKAAEQTARFLPSIIKLEEKWKQAQPELARLSQNAGFAEAVNLLEPTWDEGSRTIVARTIQSLPATAQQMMSPAVREYFEMRQSYMPIFARVLSEVGNLAEQEQVRAVALSPNALDSLDPAAGDEKFARMKGLMINAPDIMRLTFRLTEDPTLDPNERLQVIEQFLGKDAPRGQAARTPEGPPAPALMSGREKLGIILGGAR